MITTIKGDNHERIILANCWIYSKKLIKNTYYIEISTNKRIEVEDLIKLLKIETNEPVSLHLLLDAVGGGINYLQEVAYKTKFTDYNKYQGDDDDREDAQFKYAEDLIRQRIEDTISSSLYENEWYQAY